MNKVILIGRTTQDIELKRMTNGNEVTTFNIAVNRSFKNANGEYDTDFFPCVAFKKLAETISRYVKKGDLVGIEGRLQTRSYTDKDNIKRYVTEIIVDNIDFLQPKPKAEPKAEPKPKTDPFGIDPLDDDDLPF